jgi:hypothetical protein
MAIEINKLPERIGATLWPGSIAPASIMPLSQVKSLADLEDLYGSSVFYWDHPSLKNGPWVVLELTLSHPDSPITLRYTYNPDKKEADITAEGLYEASNSQIQKVLPVIDRLRVGGDLAQLTSAIHDEYYERREEREDPVKTGLLVVGQ